MFGKFNRVLLIISQKLDQMYSSGLLMTLSSIVCLSTLIVTFIINYHFSWIGFVADEISFFGNVGIIGVYMTIVVTLGGVIRNFLLPQVTTLMYGLIDEMIQHNE